jgi:hypothetical protein
MNKKLMTVLAAAMLPIAATCSVAHADINTDLGLTHISGTLFSSTLTTADAFATALLTYVETPGNFANVVSTFGTTDDAIIHGAPGLWGVSLTALPAGPFQGDINLSSVFLKTWSYPAHAGVTEVSSSQYTIAAVPGPIVGAGLPALLALAGVVGLRRRKANSAAV